MSVLLLKIKIMSYTNVSELLGKTLTKVEVKNKEEIFFKCSNGDVYKMFHDQDCCESVEITDINGDWEDLLNSPITLAEESINEENNEEDFESTTWTFYRFATVKGYVNIRWLGESNGYYSESVDFKKVTSNE